MTARFIVADVFEGLASLEDQSVDLVVTSPPFLALRSYLPADHADKGKEIGSEATPAEFIDTLLKVTAELRRVLAPHGSICVELGDTYAGSSMSGGDDQSNERYPQGRSGASYGEGRTAAKTTADGWPLAKSRTLIPSLYQIALAYGMNPLTGSESPAGQWRIRNIITWARPNPPVGALGDKWRPATSDLIVACTSGKRYWDDLATRRPFSENTNQSAVVNTVGAQARADQGGRPRIGPQINTHSGAPLLDYWVIPPGGYAGSHYAVFPEELVVPCVQAMCPQRVCVSCGEPSRRIVAHERLVTSEVTDWGVNAQVGGSRLKSAKGGTAVHVTRESTGWSDCGHNSWRPGLVLDPFAGSGTTLAVATGHGHDAIGIDLDSRNADLARDRVGPLLFETVDA